MKEICLESRNINKWLSFSILVQIRPEYTTDDGCKITKCRARAKSEQEHINVNVNGQELLWAS